MIKNQKLEITLGSKVISEKSLPYVIAEIGVNHEGSMSLAKELIDMASEGGANAAKFQTYKAAKLAAKESPPYWDVTEEKTKSQYLLFKKFDTFEPENYIELKEHCDKRDIDFLSTPFDDDAVELLDPLQPFFKIASADITNLPLLRKVASKNKPVVLSTGASTIWEIEYAVQQLRLNNVSDIALLHCMLNYPTEYKNASLDMIPKLKRLFPDLIIGYSDHTHPEIDMLTLTSAVTLGACIIEKHFTHDKTIPGNDHYHSMDMQDLKNFLKNIYRIKEVIGSFDHNNRELEIAARHNARRSIVIDKFIKKSETITKEHLTYKRPAFGISPIYWDDVIGMKVVRDLESDHILKWQDLE
jgi:sialic acid synthase SpsE